MNNLKAFRASILHFLRDPGEHDDPKAIEHFDDGLLVTDNGIVKHIGDAESILPTLPEGTEIIDHSGKLIMPGFIDTHVHYVQLDIINKYGGQLLEWLEKYTFPTERKFEDPEYAQDVANFFCDELLRNGTTTAHAFGSVHKGSVDALFEASNARNMRMVAGKVLMDRNCPEFLQDTAESGYNDSKELIEKWHKQDRALYSITPRFAPTSSNEQLERAGQLAREHPDTFIQTHVAENKAEIAWVAKLFPESRSYLDVYDRYGLLRERSVMAHCIYLDEVDRKRMAETGTTMAHCPTSNLFLGSGLPDLQASFAAGIKVGIGTDVSGGTTYNMIEVLDEMYKIAQLQNYKISAYRSFYLATLGGAESLYLDDKIGNFEAGKEADFNVINFDSTPLIKRRMNTSNDLADKLFAMIMMGDDRSISQTYIMGEAVSVLH